MKNDEIVINKIICYCKKKPGSFEARPFGKYPICFKVMGKIFAQLNPQKDFYKMTLKCNPEQAQIYRQLFPGIIVRGYHCPPVQQPYWNTIDLDVFEDMPMLLRMIDESYDAVVHKLTRKEKAQLLKLSELTYADTDGENADFAFLCGKLDQVLDELVGAKLQHSQYDQYNLRDSIHDVILVYRGKTPVACGSFKMFDEEHAELKRIYVEPGSNGIGLGAELVRRLEAKAKIAGYKWCILETGTSMQAAQHLYQKLGYQIIPNFGQYAGMPESVCMERKI